MQPLAPGAVLLHGRFAIVRLIAHGGQATTYEGVDKREGQRVAIKRFVVRGASSWKDVELAEREARVLSGLSHPGIPRHVAHFEENGELYLVTEYVDGETLDALSKGTARGDARQTSRMSQSDVISYLFAIAELLDYLQAQSPPIIHRDIKPKNVIRRGDGSFVLVDFGSVRDRLKPEGGSTVVGTFGYMAPEQFQGRALPATDTYAAAATALALLTGSDPDQLPHQGLKLDVDKALGSSVSNELKRVLKSALEPDPDQRAQRLSQLLRQSTLRTNTTQTNTQEQTPYSTGPHQTLRNGDEPQFGEVPFRTHGYQRARTAREQRVAAEREVHRAQAYATQEQQRAREHVSREERRARKHAARHQRRETRHAQRHTVDGEVVVDIETPLRHALRDRDVRRFINIPLIALLVTIVLVLARLALWFALGIAVPILLLVIYRVFGVPVLDEARRSRQIARQMRSQMRRVSQSMADGNWADESSGKRSTGQTDLGTGNQQDVKYRVESPIPNPAATARRSHVEFARQFDEEAFELETQLDAAVEKLGRK